MRTKQSSHPPKLEGDLTKIDPSYRGLTNNQTDSSPDPDHPSLCTGNVCAESVGRVAEIDLNTAILDDSVHSSSSTTAEHKSASIDGISRFFPKQLTFRSVDESTRELARLELGTDRILWRWAAFSLFYGWRDKDCHLRLLPSEALEWIWGKSIDNTGEVLKYVQERLPNLEIEEAIPNRRCRMIVNDGLSPRLYNAVRRDLTRSKMEFEKRVRFIDGRSWNTQSRARMRENYLDQAEGLYGLAPTPLGEEMCRALNKRPTNLFAKIADHVDDARAALSTLKITTDLKRDGESLADWRSRQGELEEQLRDYYLNVLDAVEHFPQTFYIPGRRGRTDRVFPLNHSPLHLPRELRAMLLQDFHEVDLQAAHLRIAASLWGAESLGAELDRPDFMIWQHLCDELNLEFSEEVKAPLKEAVYSLVYGMRSASIAGRLTLALGEHSEAFLTSVGLRFLRIPIIAELLDARNRELSAIRERGFVETPDGYTFRMESCESSGDEIDERSCLATVAQHVEQALMQVVLEHEQDPTVPDVDSFQVVLWIHDGCYVHMPRCARRHISRLQQRVRAKGEEFGVTARFEHVPPLAK